MRGTQPCRLALGLVLLGVAAGCRSLPCPPPLLDGGLVSSFPLPPDQDRAAQAHAWYSIGIHHEMADEYDLAYDAYRRAAELDPANERLVLRIASTLVLQRRTDEALRIVEEYLQRQPASENSLLWLATFYGTTGISERTHQLFRRLTEEFPTNPAGWLQLASFAERSGDSESAARILDEGLAKAQPPALLRQELVRIRLDQMQSAPDAQTKRQFRKQTIVLLRKTIEDTPGDQDALYTLGDLLVKDESLEEAVQVYEQIERLQPSDLQVKQRLARTFLAMDDQPKAIAILEKMVQGKTVLGNVHFYLAELYLQAGEAETAASHFRAAAEASPGDPSPWLKLAALQSEKDPAAAAASLDEALRIMPGNPKLLEVLALVRLTQGRYAQAADLLQQAYDATMANDDDAIPSNLFFYNYATVCTHLRRTQDAATWLRRAADQEPALIELYVQRALTGTPTFRKYAVASMKALAAMPGRDTAAIHAHLATLHLALDKPVLALRDFERVLAVVRKDPLQSAVLTPRFYFWYGVALDQCQQPDRAIEQFNTCIRLDPNYGDALNYLAYVWAVRGERLDEALRHIQTALALDPENAAYLDTLGWIYFQQGRYADALDLLQQADRLQPGDPEILNHIERAREKLQP